MSTYTVCMTGFGSKHTLETCHKVQVVFEVSGAFAKLRKATNSFIMSMSVCPHETTPLRTDFHAI